MLVTADIDLGDDTVMKEEAVQQWVPGTPVRADGNVVGVVLGASVDGGKLHLEMDIDDAVVFGAVTVDGLSVGGGDDEGDGGRID